MTIVFPTTMVKEGAASILVPELSKGEDEPLDHAISKAPVFFNPVMKLNRDLAVLALYVHQKRRSSSISACEPMCGTGVRGIRLALEVPHLDRVVLSDVDPLAVSLTEENVRLNGLMGKVEVRWIEANLLMALHSNLGGRFDYIDLDPYGSPTTYLDSALRACRNFGLLAVTATDMAPLCGINPKACLRKYGGTPLRTDYCHETALRLVAGALVKVASRFDVSATPVFSYAADHYVRLYGIIERGARKSDDALKEMGYIMHCPNCLNRRSVISGDEQDEICEVCGAEMKVGGPLWLGELANLNFVDEMLNCSEQTNMSGDSRIVNTINLVRGEIGLPPTFFNIDRLCSRLRIESLSIDNVVNALTEANFRVVKTHFDRRGVKTDASVSDLNGILQSMSRKGRL